MNYFLENKKEAKITKHEHFKMCNLISGYFVGFQKPKLNYRKMEKKHEY